jgi:hypothetical protein
MVQVSVGEEKFWIWVKRLDVMRGIRPGEVGVPIYCEWLRGGRRGSGFGWSEWRGIWIEGDEGISELWREGIGGREGDRDTMLYVFPLPVCPSTISPSPTIKSPSKHATPNPGKYGKGDNAATQGYSERLTSENTTIIPLQRMLQELLAKNII